MLVRIFLHSSPFLLISKGRLRTIHKKYINMSGGRSENTLVLALQLVLLSPVCIPSIFGNSAHGAQARRKLSTEIPGFISIDCGVDQDYYDENNGIYYKSDMEFIDTGKNMPGAINSPNRRMWNLRSFSEGIKNCYTLKPENGKGEMYLIRAHFVYGNYDGKNQPPTFDLYLGVNKWVTVSTKTENYQEIIHYSLTDKIDVCLINTGLGIPFISVLLLRHLNNSIYKIEPGALATVWRYDVGGSEVIRYKDDVYDRLWNPPNDLNWFPISTQSTIDTQSSNYSYFPPEVVLKTAARSQNYSVSLDYVLTPDDKTSEYYIIFHFAEIELLEDGQQRELNISLSGEYPLLEPIKLEYLKPLTIGPLNWKVKDEKLAFSIYPTNESKLSPILNAVELFKQILLPNSTTDQEDAKKKRKFVVPVVASIVSLLIVFLLNALFWIFWNRKRIIRGKNADSQKEDLEVPLFDLATIASATNNFSLNNKLGEGGFGPVFKGTLEGGQEIAVKKLSKTSRQGLDEFKNEVSCIAKLQHRNLVKLLGYCIQEETMLIYEYMINKSLDFFIFDQARSMLLDWHKRYHIINGIARGLLYLHQDSRLRIIHRDLKASNILLDDDMNPKISDFGLARIFEGNENEANTNRLVGTRGYMSPEYQAEGLFSVKSDVFSFGVMVLEIVSGKRNRGYYGPEDNLNLLGHAWRLFGEGRSLELSDAAIGNSCNLSEVLRSIHVGLLCVQQRPNDRPTMSSVVVMLSSESALPQPKQPGFFHERDMFEASSQYKPCSGNEVTLTLLSPR